MGFVNNLYERLGLNAYALGRYDRAETWFRRLEAAEGESARVLRNLGVALLAAGDVEEAERYFLREEELYGESYQRHRALADLYYCSGAREKALSRYTAALGDEEQVAADERDFLRSRQAICADERLFEGSVQAAGLFARGESERDCGHEEEALAFFVRAGELDGTNWPALNNAGVLELSAGHAGRALELFSRAYGCAPLPTIRNNVESARAALAAQDSGPRGLTQTGGTV